MNEISVAAETAQTSISQLMFNASAMEAVMTFGKMMAASKVTIPEHLRGKPEDCSAVVLQAMQWRFNPYAVAQKTHITQGGALGYEAQLVNAAVITSGRIEGAPDFEFIGDWNKILGKIEERKSERGGKYYVATWDRAHEAGLGVIVSAKLAGEREPRTVTVMMSQAWPRFSTQWATDPQQQITYLAVRKFARRYTPEVILGVYTNDELEPADVIDMGHVDEVPTGPRRKSESAPAPAATVIDQGTGEISPPPAPPAPTPAPRPAATTSAAPAAGGISGGQVAYLRNKLKAAGLDEASICDRFQVTGIELLNAEQFDTLKVELLAMA
jgi:hypothetical protein